MREIIPANDTEIRSIMNGMYSILTALQYSNGTTVFQSLYETRYCTFEGILI